MLRHLSCVVGLALICGCARQPQNPADESARSAGEAAAVAPSNPTVVAGLAGSPGAVAGPKPSTDEAIVATLVRAKRSYEAFLDRAADRPEYAAAVVTAKERIADIDREIDWRKTPGASAPPSR